MRVTMAIGTVADRFEKQEDELLIEVFILCDEMAGRYGPCWINLLLVGMEGNMFQESFQFAVICRWICTAMGRYYYSAIACHNLCVSKSVRVC